MRAIEREYLVSQVAARGLDERAFAQIRPHSLPNGSNTRTIGTSGITSRRLISSACSPSSRPGCVKPGNSHSAGPPSRAIRDLIDSLHAQRFLPDVSRDPYMASASIATASSTKGA